MNQDLRLPLDDYDHEADVWHFGDRVRRRWILWERHLGEDVLSKPGAKVRAVGMGEVVLAEMKKGNEEHRSWGGIVVLAHDKIQISKPKIQTKSKAQNLKTQTFYSIYGHIRDLKVKKGDKVEKGKVLGVIAGSNTPENGWWERPHLHWAIYTGPWEGNVLPGYWRVEKFWRTKMRWWHNPVKFVEGDNDVADS